MSTRFGLGIIGTLLVSWLIPAAEVFAAMTLSPTSGPADMRVYASGSLPLTSFSSSVVCQSPSFSIAWGEQSPYQTLGQGTATLDQSGYNFEVSFNVPSD